MVCRRLIKEALSGDSAKGVEEAGWGREERCVSDKIPLDGMLQPNFIGEFWSLNFALGLSQLEARELGFLRSTQPGLWREEEHQRG